MTINKEHTDMSEETTEEVVAEETNTEEVVDTEEELEKVVEDVVEDEGSETEEGETTEEEVDTEETEQTEVVEEGEETTNEEVVAPMEEQPTTPGITMEEMTNAIANGNTEVINQVKEMLAPMMEANKAITEFFQTNFVSNQNDPANVEITEEETEE